MTRGMKSSPGTLFLGIYIANDPPGMTHHRVAHTASHRSVPPGSRQNTHEKQPNAQRKKRKEKLTLFGLQAAGAVFVGGASDRSIDRSTDSFPHPGS